MKDFEVVLSRKRWESVKVRVTAKSKEAAERKALKEAEDLDWNCGDAEDDIIVEVFTDGEES